MEVGQEAGRRGGQEGSRAGGAPGAGFGSSQEGVSQSPTPPPPQESSSGAAESTLPCRAFPAAPRPGRAFAPARGSRGGSQGSEPTRTPGAPQPGREAAPERRTNPGVPAPRLRPPAYLSLPGTFPCFLSGKAISAQASPALRGSPAGHAPLAPIGPPLRPRPPTGPHPCRGWPVKSIGHALPLLHVPGASPGATWDTLLKRGPPWPALPTRPTPTLTWDSATLGPVTLPASPRAPTPRGKASLDSRTPPPAPLLPQFPRLCRIR